VKNARVRIIKNEAVAGCGSFEVRYADTTLTKQMTPHQITMFDAMSLFEFTKDKLYRNLIEAPLALVGMKPSADAFLNRPPQ
jgi:hypothetical protein